MWKVHARETRERRRAGPSRLRRSLARSRAARFARPNRRACSQANSRYSMYRLHSWYSCLLSRTTRPWPLTIAPKCRAYSQARYKMRFLILIGHSSHFHGQQLWLRDHRVTQNFQGFLLLHCGTGLPYFIKTAFRNRVTGYKMSQGLLLGILLAQRKY